MLGHLGRSLTGDLQKVEVRQGEAEALQAIGIDDLTIQRYLVWRRSMLFAVIGLTLLTALGRTAFEVLDIPEPIDRVMVFVEKAEARLEQLRDEESPDDDAMDGPEPAAPKNTAFGDAAGLAWDASLYALPISALAALLCWQKLRWSRRWLLIGWLISFLIPVGLALTPYGWWTAQEPMPTDPIKRLARQIEDVAEGMAYGYTLFIIFLPNVLSLVPGVQRACLRIKTLLPQSIVPGWFLVSATPFYSLLLLVVFVAFSQIATNLLLLFGMLLWMAAPMLYLVNVGVYTQPLLTPEDRSRLRRVQLCVVAVLIVAMALLITYFLTRTILNRHILGFHENDSLFLPWDFSLYFLEYLGRSLFITVLVADIFMQVNWSIWHNDTEFSRTPHALEYGHTMEQLHKAME